MANNPVKFVFSNESKIILSKLPAAELIPVMEDIIGKVAVDVNNAENINNASMPAELSAEALTEANKLPKEYIKNLLIKKGIID